MAQNMFKTTDLESLEQREKRLIWERARLAEAEADLRAGNYIEGEELDAFLENELAEAEAAMAREAG